MTKMKKNKGNYDKVMILWFEQVYFVVYVEYEWLELIRNNWNQNWTCYGAFCGFKALECKYEENECIRLRTWCGQVYIGVKNMFE